MDDTTAGIAELIVERMGAPGEPSPQPPVPAAAAAVEGDDDGGMDAAAESAMQDMFVAMKAGNTREALAALRELNNLVRE